MEHQSPVCVTRLFHAHPGQQAQAGWKSPDVKDGGRSQVIKEGGYQKDMVAANRLLEGTTVSDKHILLYTRLLPIFTLATSQKGGCAISTAQGGGGDEGRVNEARQTFGSRHCAGIVGWVGGVSTGSARFPHSPHRSRYDAPCED